MTLQSEPKFIFTDSKAAPWLDSKVASLDYARGKESPESESRRINDLRTK